MTLCPTALIATAHGRCMRLLAEKAPIHPRGLTSASRALRSQLPSRLQRRLTQLDVAFSVVRHITGRSCEDLEKELAAALGLDAHGPDLQEATTQTAISAPRDPLAALRDDRELRRRRAPLHGCGADGGEVERKNTAAAEPQGAGHGGSDPRRDESTALLSDGVDAPEMREGAGTSAQEASDANPVEEYSATDLEDAPLVQRDVRRRVFFATNPPERGPSLEDSVREIALMLHEMQQKFSVLASGLASNMEGVTALASESKRHLRRIDELEGQLRACERRLGDAGNERGLRDLQALVWELRHDVDDLTLRAAGLGARPGSLTQEPGGDATTEPLCAFVDDAAWDALRAASRRHRDELDRLCASASPDVCPTAPSEPREGRASHVDSEDASMSEADVDSLSSCDLVSVPGYPFRFD